MYNKNGGKCMKGMLNKKTRYIVNSISDNNNSDCDTISIGYTNNCQKQSNR